VNATRAHGSYEIGNRGTHQAGAGFGWLGQRLAAAANARAFTTDGYYVVREEEIGPVDREANVRFLAGDARVDVLGTTNNLFVKFDFLTEDRGNGTIAQRNSTSLGTISGHYARDKGRDNISVIGYHTRVEFHNTFSSVSDDHTQETPTTQQRVPATGTGGAALWRHTGSAWSSLVGGDAQRVEGFSHDLVLTSGFRRSAGGELIQHGYFGQMDYQTGPAQLFAGARVHFADQGRRFFSPNAGAVVSRGILRFRGSVYRAYRVPTLNELYRPFRVGNVVTNPNENLTAESLTGVEAGLDAQGETRRLSVTLFYDDLDDLVSNVTQSVTPNLITRQRQNTDEAVTRGVEAEVSQRWRNITGHVAYLFSDSHLRTGLRVPQVAKHQGSALVTYQRGGMWLTAGLRAYSSQFEDDLNEFLLPGFAVVHVRWMQRLSGPLFAMVAFDNILDREYIVGYTPSARIGSPRLWRVGLRWDGGR
jgi:outer membrane receptor protein involved in Fe transport